MDQATRIDDKPTYEESPAKSAVTAAASITPQKAANHDDSPVPAPSSSMITPLHVQRKKRMLARNKPSLTSPARTSTAVAAVTPQTDSKVTSTSFSTTNPAAASPRAQENRLENPLVGYETISTASKPKRSTTKKPTADSSSEPIPLSDLVLGDARSGRAYSFGGYAADASDNEYEDDDDEDEKESSFDEDEEVEEYSHYDGSDEPSDETEDDESMDAVADPMEMYHEREGFHYDDETMEELYYYEQSSYEDLDTDILEECNNNKVVGGKSAASNTREDPPQQEVTQDSFDDKDTPSTDAKAAHKDATRKEDSNADISGKKKKDSGKASCSNTKEDPPQKEAKTTQDIPDPPVENKNTPPKESSPRKEEVARKESNADTIATFEISRKESNADTIATFEVARKESNADSIATFASKTTTQSTKTMSQLAMENIQAKRLKVLRASREKEADLTHKQRLAKLQAADPRLWNPVDIKKFRKLVHKDNQYVKGTQKEEGGKAFASKAVGADPRQQEMEATQDHPHDSLLKERILSKEITRKEMESTQDSHDNITKDKGPLSKEIPSARTEETRKDSNADRKDNGKTSSSNAVADPPQQQMESAKDIPPGTLAENKDTPAKKSKTSRKTKARKDSNPQLQEVESDGLVKDKKEIPAKESSTTRKEESRKDSNLQKMEPTQDRIPGSRIEDITPKESLTRCKEVERKDSNPPLKELEPTYGSSSDPLVEEKDTPPRKAPVRRKGKSRKERESTQESTDTFVEKKGAPQKEIRATPEEETRKNLNPSLNDPMEEGSDPFEFVDDAQRKEALPASKEAARNESNEKFSSQERESTQDGSDPFEFVDDAPTKKTPATRKKESRKDLNVDNKCSNTAQPPELGPSLAKAIIEYERESMRELLVEEEKTTAPTKAKTKRKEVTRKNPSPYNLRARTAKLPADVDQAAESISPKAPEKVILAAANDPLICPVTGRRKKKVPGLGLVYVDERESVEVDPAKGGKPIPLEERLMTAAKTNDWVVLTNITTTATQDQVIDPEVWAEALHAAVVGGHLEAVRILWGNFHANRHPRSPNKCPKGKAWTRFGVRRPDLSPLHAALHNGHFEILQVFLEDFNLDPGDLDENHDTALVLACMKNDLKAVQLLLDNDADPYVGCIRRREGQPQKKAPKKGDSSSQNEKWHRGALYAVQNKKWHCGALYAAVEKGLVAAAKLILEHGVDPDNCPLKDVCAEKDQHLLPLDMALAKPNREMVKLLLEHGATRFGAVKLVDQDCTEPFLFRMAGNAKARDRIIQYLGEVASEREQAGSKAAANYLGVCLRMAIHVVHHRGLGQRFYLRECRKLLEAGASPTWTDDGHPSTPPFDELLSQFASAEEKDNATVQVMLDLALEFFRNSADLPAKNCGFLLRTAFEKRITLFHRLLSQWTMKFPTGRNATQDTLLHLVCRLPNFDPKLTKAVMVHHSRVLAALDRDWALVDCANGMDLDVSFALARQFAASFLRINFQYKEQGVFRESPQQISERRERLRNRQMTQRAQRKLRREERARLQELARRDNPSEFAEEERSAQPTRKRPRNNAKSELDSTKPAKRQSSRLRKSKLEEPAQEDPPGKLDFALAEGSPQPNQKQPRRKARSDLVGDSTKPATKLVKEASHRKQPSRAYRGVSNKPPAEAAQSAKDNPLSVNQKPAHIQATSERPVTRSQKQRQAKEESRREGSTEKKPSAHQTSKSERSRSPGKKIVSAFQKLPNEAHPENQESAPRRSGRKRAYPDYFTEHGIEEGGPRYTHIRKKKPAKPAPGQDAGNKPAATNEEEPRGYQRATAVASEQPSPTPRVTRSRKRPPPPPLCDEVDVAPRAAALASKPSGKASGEAKKGRVWKHSGLRKKDLEKLLANEQVKEDDKGRQGKNKRSSWLFRGPERHPVDEDDDDQLRPPNEITTSSQPEAETETLSIDCKGGSAGGSEEDVASKNQAHKQEEEGKPDEEGSDNDASSSSSSSSDNVDVVCVMHHERRRPSSSSEDEEEGDDDDETETEDEVERRDSIGIVQI